MRVDRKVWGPGPLPGSRIVLARPGDEVSDAMWERIKAAELKKPASVEDKPVVVAEADDSAAPKTPVVKKQARRKKKASD